MVISDHLGCRIRHAMAMPYREYRLLSEDGIYWHNWHIVDIVFYLSIISWYGHWPCQLYRDTTFDPSCVIMYVCSHRVVQVFDITRGEVYRAARCKIVVCVYVQHDLTMSCPWNYTPCDDEYPNNLMTKHVSGLKTRDIGLSGLISVYQD